MSQDAAERNIAQRTSTASTRHSSSESSSAPHRRPAGGPRHGSTHDGNEHLPHSGGQRRGKRGGGVAGGENSNERGRAAGDTHQHQGASSHRHSRGDTQIAYTNASPLETAEPKPDAPLCLICFSPIAYYVSTPCAHSNHICASCVLNMKMFQSQSDTATPATNLPTTAETKDPGQLPEGLPSQSGSGSPISGTSDALRRTSSSGINGTSSSGSTTPRLSRSPSAVVSPTSNSPYVAQGVLDKGVQHRAAILSCPYCHVKWSKVAIGANPIDWNDMTKETTDGKSNLSKLVHVPELGELYCENRELALSVLKLCSIYCTVCDANTAKSNRTSSGLCTFQTVAELNEHLKEKHGNRSLCIPCLVKQNAFIHAFRPMTPSQLTKHYEHGERLENSTYAITPPHPFCRFCNEPFFSNDELLAHMLGYHYTCRICYAKGKKGHYRDAPALVAHLQSEHFVCTHQVCFTPNEPHSLVVYSSALDLELHSSSFHGKKRALDLNRMLSTGSKWDTSASTAAGSNQSGAGAKSAAEVTYVELASKPTGDSKRSEAEERKMRDEFRKKHGLTNPNAEVSNRPALAAGAGAGSAFPELRRPDSSSMSSLIQATTHTKSRVTTPAFPSLSSMGGSSVGSGSAFPSLGGATAAAAAAAGAYSNTNKNTKTQGQPSTSQRPAVSELHALAKQQKKATKAPSTLASTGPETKSTSKDEVKEPEVDQEQDEARRKRQQEAQQRLRAAQEAADRAAAEALAQALNVTAAAGSQSSSSQRSQDSKGKISTTTPEFVPLSSMTLTCQSSSSSSQTNKTKAPSPPVGSLAARVWGMSTTARLQQPSPVPSNPTPTSTTARTPQFQARDMFQVSLPTQPVFTASPEHVTAFDDAIESAARRDVNASAISDLRLLLYILQRTMSRLATSVSSGDVTRIVQCTQGQANFPRSTKLQTLTNNVNAVTLTSCLRFSGLDALGLKSQHTDRLSIIVRSYRQNQSLESIADGVTSFARSLTIAEAYALYFYLFALLKHLTSDEVLGSS